MSGRGSQVSRIYTILNLLEGAPQGLTVAEVTERVCERGHEASKRTVYRDLEALSGAGFPLHTDETRWVLERTTKVGQYLVLSSRELVALYFARGALGPLRETPFYEDLERVFARIEEKLGKKGLEYFRELSAEMKFEPGPRWGLGIDPDVLETVRAACTERQCLSVMYKHTRKLGPHYLYFARGSLYLVAEDLEDAQVKVFALPRMSEARMLDEEYAGEPVLPESYFAQSFGVFRGEQAVDVQLEFLSSVAGYVRERRWHESQRVVSRADGTVAMSLSVALTPDLTQWVLGFGDQVRVVAPDALRTQIVAAAEKVLRQYKPKRVA